MTLRWDLSKIKDKDKLHAEEKSWLLTQAVIFLSQTIGMTEITRQNVPEWVSRSEQLLSVRPYTGKHHKITEEEFLRREGMTTTAEALNTQEFESKLSRLYDSASTGTSPISYDGELPEEYQL